MNPWTKTKTKLFIAAAGVLAATAATTTGLAADPPAAAAPPTTQPRDLATIRKERLDLLEQELRRFEQLYDQGRSSSAEVMDRRQELLQARIDMAADLNDELAARQQLLQLLQQRENIANAQWKQGLVDLHIVTNLRNTRLREEYLLAKRQAEAKLSSAKEP